MIGWFLCWLGRHYWIVDVCHHEPAWDGKSVVCFRCGALEKELKQPKRGRT